jgi:predicted anti-sigma-YlaC factor YlaD
MSSKENSKGSGKSQIRCEDIQDLLFAYMSHELGQARSVLVREHLRKCRQCTKEAAEIQSTLELLSMASKETTNIPSRLTDERRKKLYWWYSHPLMLWIENNHIVVSFIVTLVVITIIAVVMVHVKLWEEREPEDIYPVWIGGRITDATNAAATQVQEDPPEGENH